MYTYVHTYRAAYREKEEGRGEAARAPFSIVSYILITIRRIRDKYTYRAVRTPVILLLARRLGEDDPQANCRGVYRACLVNIIGNRYRRSARVPRNEQDDIREATRRCVSLNPLDRGSRRARVVSLLSKFSYVPSRPRVRPRDVSVLAIH